MKPQASVRSHRLQVRTVVVRISRKLRATYRVRHGRLFSELLVALLTVFSPLARALPDAATMNVTAGQVKVDASSTASSLVLNQGSNKAILDWRTFNIGAGESVQFRQPDASSVALNRITGGASTIYGALTANGQVFLVNPAGVLFAPGAQVNVGGLVASTLDLGNSDFLDGRYTFSGSGGSVVNQGSLNGSYVVLAAPSVTNAGNIAAQRGSVGLLAGSRVTVDPSGAGLVKFSVDAAAVNAAVTNSGTITADGGQVAVLASALSDTLPTVINQSGVIRANSIADENGTIVLGGGSTGVVSVSGTLEAKGDHAGESGGTVKVLGDRVGLMAGASVDASGDAGGGTVLVGGNFQGKGPEQNASATVVADGARIDANATGKGSGGRVIVWSDEGTVFAGDAGIRGAGPGGQGGFAEVSGKQFLAFTGNVDASGSQGGARGTLLLDPLNLVVGGSPDVNGDGTTGDDLTTNVLAAGSFAGRTSFVSGAAVQAQLGAANVTLQAVDQLVVNDRITSASANSLTLQAGGNVSINNFVTLAGGNLTLSGNDPIGPASGSGRAIVAAPIDVGTGTITLLNNGSSAPNVVADRLTAGRISISGSTLLLGNVVMNAGTGTISTHALTGLDVGDKLTLTAAGGAVTGAISNLDTLTTTVGTSLTATSVAAGNASLGGNVSTAGGQAYTSTTLTNGVTLRDTAGRVIALGTLSGGGKDLTVVSGGGITATGGISGVGLLTANAGTNVTASSVDVNALGIGGSLTATTGNVTVATSTTLFDHSTIASNAAAGTVALGNVTSLSRNLTLTAAGGATAGNLNTTGLLTTTAGTNLTASTVSGMQANLGGDVTATTGNIFFGSAITLGQDVTITAAGAGRSVSLQAVAGNGHSLTAVADGNLGTAAISGVNNLTLTAGTNSPLTTGTVSVTGNYSAQAGDFRGGSLSPTLGAASNFTIVDTADGLVTGGLTAGGNLSVTTTNGGALSVIGAMTSSGGNVNLASAGTLDLGASSVSAAGSATLTGTSVTGSGSLNSGTQVVVDAGAGSAALSGAIGGAGGLEKKGTGTLTLTGTNSYTGATTITAGTLATAGTGIGDGSAVTVGAGGTLALTGNETIGSLAGAGAVALGSSTLTAGGDGRSTTFSGIISGTGDLTKAGTGTMTLSGVNLYTGMTTVNAGTLAVGGSSLEDTGSVMVSTSGTLLLAGSETIGALMGNGNVTLNGNLTTGGNGAHTTFFGVLSGAGGLTKNGVGTMTLAGANTYTGATTINGGTLSAGGANIGDASAVSVAAGATLALTGSETIGSLAGAGNVSNVGQLTVGGNNTNTTFSGSISGGALNKTGTGTLALTGTNNFTANTQVLAGTLSVNGNAINDGNHVQVVAGGTLALTGSETVGSVGGSGNIDLGANTLTTGGAFSSFFDGVISGSGGVTKTGAGTTFTLAGTNTYTGTTTISAGTLQIAGGSIAASSGVANGATLDLQSSTTVAAISGTGDTSLNANVLTIGDGSNRSSSYAGTISGAGGVVKAGTGTLTLSGTNTYSGATSVNAGTLVLAHPTDTLSGNTAVSVAAGATLDLGANTETVGSLDLAGSLDGTGTLTAATYTLNGATVNANLGAGTLTQASGTSTLNGTAAAATVNVTGGTLALGAATNRLTGAGAAIGIAAGATLDTGAASQALGGGTAVVTNAGTFKTGAAVTAGSIGGAGTASLGGNVTTSGAQSYGTATLTGAATLTASTITAGAITAGANALGLNTTAGATTGAITGTGTLTTTGNLAAASIAMGSANLGGNVTTVTTQSYTGAMTLAGDATLSGTTITAAAIDTAGNDLTISGTGTATTGAITGGGALTANNDLNAGTISVASATLNGDTVSSGAVSTTGNLTTAAGKTLDATSVAVGGAASLGGDVTTTGAQTYTGPVTVAAGATLNAVGALTATNAGNVFGNGTQFAVAQDGGGAGTLDVAGDFAGSVGVAGNATNASLRDSSAGTQLVVSGLAADPDADVTLVAAGGLQVDAAGLSPVANLSATTQGGDLAFLNSGTLRGGTPGVLATGALTLSVTGGSLNSAGDPLVINEATPVVDITGTPAFTQWQGHTPPPAATPDALLLQAGDVAGTASRELDAMLAADVRDGTGLLRTERLVLLGGMTPAQVAAPLQFRTFSVRLPRCADEQQKAQPGCR
jgi:filamentous hemagglutinin family protein